MEGSGTSESGSAGQEDSREEVAFDGVLEYWRGFGDGHVGVESTVAQGQSSNYNAGRGRRRGEL